MYLREDNKWSKCLSDLLIVPAIVFVSCCCLNNASIASLSSSALFVSNSLIKYFVSAFRKSEWSKYNLKVEISSELCA